MVRWWGNFAIEQSRAEIARQYGVMQQVEIRRRVLALLPFVIALLFLPAWLCIVTAILVTVLEWVGFNRLGEVDPAEQPQLYLGTLACYALAQIAYMTIPALIWQNPDPIAKAFAIGMFLINLVHLSTIRTVHFPLAFVALVPATLISVSGNSYFWIRQGNWTGLGISTVCVIAIAYFVHLMMTTVHGLHQEMFQNQLAAQAANEAKSRFLAQMSHELRTPLNAILGMGNAELTTATNPESKERLATLVQSARSLSVLLDDILDLTAVEAGQLPIRPAVIDLRAETNATLALFRQQIADLGMRLDVSFDDRVPALAWIDGQRFRQCLSNLLSNAIKYAQHGAIEIAVSAPASGNISVELADSGPGIPERLRERIFEPFHRGDSLVAGTGLGLAISRTLARRMGGDLVLLPGETGARFLLTFAVLPAESNEAAAAPPKVLPDLSGCRVLIVDDIATNRFVAMTYLRILGAIAIEAETGEAALTVLEREGVDLVLLDMLMPGMDGLTTFRRIRALSGPATKVPVIAMTADASEERRLHYLAAGLNGYVSKPLAPEMLSAAILAVLPAPPAESDTTGRF